MKTRERSNAPKQARKTVGTASTPPAKRGTVYDDMSPEERARYRQEVETQLRQDASTDSPADLEANVRHHSFMLAVFDSRGTDREREQNVRTILSALHRCGSRNIRFLARMFRGLAEV